MVYLVFFVVWRTLIFVSSTSTIITKEVASLCTASVYRTDSLKFAVGGGDDALVVEPSRGAFELVIGRNLRWFGN